MHNPAKYAQVPAVAGDRSEIIIGGGLSVSMEPHSAEATVGPHPCEFLIVLERALNGSVMAGNVAVTQAAGSAFREPGW